MGLLTGYIREVPLQALYEHWRERTANGERLPGRADMDVLDLPVAALPHAFIYEREDDGRIRCRLGGTRFADDLGYEPTGGYLDERLSLPMFQRRLAFYADCLDGPRAVYFRGRMTPIGQEYRESGRLLLPVAGTDGTARFVFGGMVVAYTQAEAATDTGLEADGVLELHVDDPIGRDVAAR